jgi:hypothetical protein
MGLCHGVGDIPFKKGYVPLFLAQICGCGAGWHEVGAPTLRGARVAVVEEGEEASDAQCGFNNVWDTCKHKGECC